MCDASDRLHPVSTCLGGMCKQGTVIPCSPYACDAVVLACKTSCAVNTDCARMKTCTVVNSVGTCGP
jgi:hypothetical protein